MTSPCEHNGTDARLLGRNDDGFVEWLCGECGNHVTMRSPDFDSAWFVTLHPAANHELFYAGWAER